MFDLIKFFQPDYLFDFRPTVSQSSLEIMLSFFTAFLLAGIILKIIGWKKNWRGYQLKLTQKYFSFFIALGLLGLLLIFFRYEQSMILAARFWLVVWSLLAVGWLILILNYQLKALPEAKKQSAERKLFQKYLPKKK